MRKVFAFNKGLDVVMNNFTVAQLGLSVGTVVDKLQVHQPVVAWRIQDVDLGSDKLFEKKDMTTYVMIQCSEVIVYIW